MKKMVLVLLLLIIATLVFSAGASEAENEKEKLVFYGKIVEYTSGVPMTDALQEALADKYEIEAVQVDWGNLQTVIKTGIASGKPADVYQYWPQEMKPFVDANMALDLTPYLEADNGKWLEEFGPTLETGKYNGKYYNLPMDTNFPVIYVNKQIFEKAGVKVPYRWSWDEFITACQTIKEKTDTFPFVLGSSPDTLSWVIRNGIASWGVAEDKISELVSGSVPVAEMELGTILGNIKDLVDNGYWYPGPGAMTVKRDEAKAAFYQQKVGMLAEVSAFAKSMAEEADGFEVVIVGWPYMFADGDGTLGGCDGLFVPANARNIEGSIEMLKTYLGREIQAIHAEYGYPITNPNVEISDSIVKSAVEHGNYIKASREFTSLSPQITKYIYEVITQEYVLEMKTLSEIVDELESMRLKALQ
jgi:ABC-type glycerol-3-phosphate transport system substrate-binding protein